MKIRRHQKNPTNHENQEPSLLSPANFRSMSTCPHYLERKTEMISKFFRKKFFLTLWATRSFGSWWTWESLVSLFLVCVIIFCLKGKRNEERERKTIYGQLTNAISLISSSLTKTILSLFSSIHKFTCQQKYSSHLYEID